VDALERNYRRASLSIRAATIRDLMLVWPMLNRSEMDASFPGWASIVATLVRRDHDRVATLAGAYLAASRAQSGVSGAPLILAAALATTQVDNSLATTARAGYFTALRYYAPDKASDTSLVRTAGAVGRLVLDGGRKTITDSLQADPRGQGWRRVIAPSACDFCVMLAGRGAVYSAETARFSSHDHCACSAMPVYGRTPIPVVPFEPSKKRRSAETRAKDNQRVRDFIAG
jgi:hypothetical protein